jgi:hypothetical protein
MMTRMIMLSLIMMIIMLVGKAMCWINAAAVLPSYPLISVGQMGQPWSYGSPRTDWWGRRGGGEKGEGGGK